MKRILLVGATLLALATTQPAVAQPMPIFNWSGFYIGAHGGYAWGDTTATDVEATNGACWNTCGDQFTARVTGGVFGGQFGWNWQTPGSALLWGIEADIGWLGVKGSQVSSISTSTFVNTRGGLYVTGRGRLGVVSGNALFFVTGGIIGADTKSTVNDASVIVDLNTEPTFAVGWTVGGGIEWMLAPNWTIKADVLWYDLGTKKVGGTISGGVIQFFDIKQTGTMARVGINWKM